VILLLAACASGTLTTDQGAQPLRTALFWQDADTAQLFLSNGDLSCDLPALDDTDAVIAATFAACREGARHTLLTLNQDGGWQLEQALWLSVNEAAIATEDGLARELVVTDWDVVWHAEDGGSVDFSSQTASRWSGDFDLPAVDVHGHFRADSCAADSTLFSWLGDADVVTCP